MANYKKSEGILHKSLTVTGTTPILESEPIEIPNAKQCRVNHGLVAAIPLNKQIELQRKVSEKKDYSKKELDTIAKASGIKYHYKYCK